jgi:HK97 family phage portal protein
MGYLASKLEVRNIPSVIDIDNWMEIGWGMTTKTGVMINEQNALKYSAVWACVRVLSETIGHLPLNIYQAVSGGCAAAPDHPLQEILHTSPNPEMTAFTWRETMMSHLALWGNCYSFIDWGLDGQVKALWPLPPNRMKVKRFNNQIIYLLRLKDGNELTFQAWQIFHVVGLGFDGTKGYSVIAMARESVGLGQAYEEFGAALFGNGLHPGVVVTHPSKLTEQGHKNLKEDLQDKYAGLGKAHKLMLLEEGMTIAHTQVPPNDAQFLESKQFQVREICRWYRMQPHKIGDLSDATFSNIEQQSIEHVTDTILPWVIRWEQQITWKLMLPQERKKYFANFALDAIIRGDTTSRYAAYAVARQWGWMSADDVRRKENMNPLPNGQGQMYMVPLNMVPANSLDTTGTTSAPPTKDWDTQAASVRRLTYEQRTQQVVTARLKLARAHQRLFEDAAARIVRREINDVQRGAEKSLRNDSGFIFDNWLNDYYGNFYDFMSRQMKPVMQTYGEEVHGLAADEIGIGGDADTTMDGLDNFVHAYLGTFVQRYTYSSIDQLRAVVRQAIDQGQSPMEMVSQRLSEWEQKRPGKVAGREMIQLNNAVAQVVYKNSGIPQKRWNTNPKDSPFCWSLDGKVIGIDEHFVDGGSVVADGKSVTPKSKVGHPPLIGGCNCMITAERGK